MYRTNKQNKKRMQFLLFSRISKFNECINKNYGNYSICQKSHVNKHKRGIKAFMEQYYKNFIWKTDKSLSYQKKLERFNIKLRINESKSR